MVNNHTKIFPLLIIVSTGAVFGFFCWRIWFYPPPFSAFTGLNEGQWIGAKNNSSVCFLRKVLYISEGIESAWIIIGSIGAYTLHVNGKKIEEFSDAESTYSYGVHDLTGNLRKGKNAICISVAQKQPKGYSRAVVEGAYVDISNKKHFFYSDETWLAQNRELSQEYGERPWYDVSYDDLEWEQVKSYGKVLGEPFLSNILPEVITLPPMGAWLLGDQTTIGDFIVGHSFNLAILPKAAWIRLASTGQCLISVNGVKIVEQFSNPNNLVIYDIRPLLRRGSNDINIHVSSTHSLQPKVQLDGILTNGSSSELFLFTDINWRIKNTFSEWTNVDLVLPYYSEIDTLQKMVKEISPSQYYHILTFGRQLIVLILFIFFFIIVSIGCTALFSRLEQGSEFWDLLSTDSLLHIPSLGILGMAFIVQFNPQFGPSFPYHPMIFAIAVALISLLRLFFFVQVVLKKYDTKEQ